MQTDSAEPGLCRLSAISNQRSAWIQAEFLKGRLLSFVSSNSIQGKVGER